MNAPSTGIDPIIIVFFVYGLAFYTMGLALALEIGGRIGDLEVHRAMKALALFGILHGLHEWYEMFLKIEAQVYRLAPSRAVEVLRVVLLAVSFAALCVSGCRLLCSGQRPFFRRVALLVFILFAAGMGAIVARLAPRWDVLLPAADVWTRYSLGVTGAVLTGSGLLVRARYYAVESRAIASGLATAGLALSVYGLAGQSAPPPSVLFPSTVYNAQTFLRLFGFPVQMLRAAAAATSTTGLLVALRALEMQRQRALQAAIDARLAAQATAQEEMARREALQKELLRQTVAVQEEERARIARELHDHTGQTLTALTYRAAALEALLNGGNTPREQIGDLRRLADQALADLHHLVTDLRPAQLDDLGLVAALHWLADQAHTRLGLEVTVEVEGRRARLSGDVETTLFRVAQEALTNVARHAGVDRARVCLSFDPCFVKLEVEDRGCGFDVKQVYDAALSTGERPWELIGMEERVYSVDGRLHLLSKPGKGTTVRVMIPMPREEPDE